MGKIWSQEPTEAQCERDGAEGMLWPKHHSSINIVEYGQNIQQCFKQFLILVNSKFVIDSTLLKNIN